MVTAFLGGSKGPWREGILAMAYSRWHTNDNGKRPLPVIEEAGFSFVRYRAFGSDNDNLLLERHQPEPGIKRIMVAPNGIEAG